MQQQLVGNQSLPAIPEEIACWHSWSPQLCRPENTNDLMKRCQEVCAFSGATSVALIDRESVGSLNHSAWKGIDTLVREHCYELVKSFAIDGNLMRAQMNSLYPDSMAFGVWEELFSEPSTITVRSQLMENVRILLFYVTILSHLGCRDEMVRFKPFLDLARDGFIPLGISLAHSHQFLVITG